MKKLVASAYIWNGQTMFFGILPDNREHAHHLIQIGIGLNRPFRIHHNKGSHECRFAMVAPDEPHRVDDHDDWQVLIHVDPETDFGQHLKMTSFSDERIRILPLSAIEPFLEQLQDYKDQIHSCEEAKRLLNGILYSLIGETISHGSIDPRIQEAIDIMKQMPQKKISTKSLAASVHLSEGRLIHLFKEQVGIPIRRYLLWLRLADAMYRIPAGVSYTEAAHHAGFADSAHLSRTYRRMFGMRLVDFQKRSQLVEAVRCF